MSMKYVGEDIVIKPIKRKTNSKSKTCKHGYMEDDCELCYEDSLTDLAEEDPLGEKYVPVNFSGG